MRCGATPALPETTIATYADALEALLAEHDLGHSDLGTHAGLTCGAVPRRRVVIDHVAVGVSDLARSRTFYARALVPLGFAEIGPWREGGTEVAFGLEEADDFAISTQYPTGAPVHVAFAADRREQVDAFYAAALAAA